MRTPIVGDTVQFRIGGSDNSPVLRTALVERVLDSTALDLIVKIEDSDKSVYGTSRDARGGDRGARDRSHLGPDDRDFNRERAANRDARDADTARRLDHDGGAAYPRDTVTGESSPFTNDEIAGGSGKRAGVVAGTAIGQWR